ncbi:MAG: hypothetical protein AAB699_00130 [Patescibacteria group bacterium]
MHSDIHWFLGLLVVLAVVWWVGNGTLKQDRLSGAATTKAPVSRSASGGSSPGALPAREETAQTVAERISQAEGEVARLRAELTRAQEEEKNSAPLGGKLSIAAVKRSARPEQEYVVLRASKENAEPVLITGLTLRGAVGRLRASIPLAWTLPYLNARGEGDRVFLQPGGTAYIASGRSPLALTTGVLPNRGGFQRNACTGYFAQGTSFYPALPRECPHPSREPLPLPPNHLSDACLDYLETLPSCTTHGGAFPESLRADAGCQRYLTETATYDRCVALHKNEPGFYRNEWRIYLGRDSRLWRDRREMIELVDEAGRLIDAYRY